MSFCVLEICIVGYSLCVLLCISLLLFVHATVNYGFIELTIVAD